MTERYVELNAFLKARGIAPTGGTAKLIIRDGQVKVNGSVETQNKKKLHTGDRIELDRKKLIVTDEECRQEK